MEAYTEESQKSYWQNNTDDYLLITWHMKSQKQ